ncbi:hypothetical protein [Aquella oligotrophica]|uniref:Uncharacterized protein n=1 Tax=Aquella oligotrophica TaxID=2067065 RepID=A0A2I7N6J6_9NEIS|nr:hypothetical protein [Aquella oligotrophica]AUR52074.1 hypothetical protein CUN60_07095 [Aquella oligotrophica]
MKKIAISSLLLSSILISSCSSGSSGSNPNTPAQQFATTITSQSIQIANSLQTLQLATFPNKQNIAYLLAHPNNDAYTHDLYYFNGNSWQQNTLTFKSQKFDALTMTYANSGLYLGGSDDSVNNGKAQLYFYNGITTQLIESNPYLQHCNNYCYINALTTANNNSTIYTSGVDDNGIEIYMYDGSWTILPSAPRATESAFIVPSDGYMYLLGVKALTVDSYGNLYLGAAFGAYKGPYEGYLAKFSNGAWQQESLPQQFSWSVNGLTFVNNLLYTAGSNNAYFGAPSADYSISSLYNTQWNQLYSYTVTESSQYGSPSGIYSDSYGNIYSLMEQNGLGNVMTLSIPASN